MVMAVANAPVPRFTVIIGGSFGAATTGCADAPTHASVVDVAKCTYLCHGWTAAGNRPRHCTQRWTGSARPNDDPEEEAAFMQPILDKYEEEGNPYYSTAACGMMGSSIHAIHVQFWL